VADNQEAYEFYKTAQVAMCGSYAEVDIWCDAAELAMFIATESLDYVVSSHMIEHHPNPLKVLEEWALVLKLGGVVFMIFPKRNAHPTDQQRELTPFQTFIDAYDQGLTVETAPLPTGHGKGGHYYVYDTGLMLALVGCLNDRILEPKGYRLNVEEVLETDDKVGNGHCIVLRSEMFGAGEPEFVPVPPNPLMAEVVDQSRTYPHIPFPTRSERYRHVILILADH
jgi:SAM-dependent methyltransferase